VLNQRFRIRLWYRRKATFESKRRNI